MLEMMQREGNALVLLVGTQYREQYEGSLKTEK